jgi:hypothetical protein
MVRARLAGRRGIRKEPVAESPSIGYTNSKPGGSGLGSIAHLFSLGWRGTPGPGEVAGREATVEGCGVAVARVQGQSWVPIPSKGSKVNVGTIPGIPDPLPQPAAVGRGGSMAGRSGRGGAENR